jgi:hypothetical protein
VFGLVVDRTQAMHSYLFAYELALSIALGALVLLMIGHVAHATWMVALRRAIEAVASPLPLLALLIVPILLLARDLYVWTGPLDGFDAESARRIAEKRGWLSIPAMSLRAVVFHASWLATFELLRRWSIRSDEVRDPALVARQRRLAAVALPPLAITLTLASFDWFMSLEPAWSSNIYGIYVFAGGFAGACAMVCLVAVAMRRAALLPDRVGESHFHALGNVLLASICVWGYIAFSQLLVQWIGDLPEDVGWYLRRVSHGWGWVVVLLVATHFALPFLALLIRRWKRTPSTLAAIAGVALVGHMVDAYWLILPVLHPAPRPHWLDVSAILAIGGGCVAVGAHRLRTRATIPIAHPDLGAALRFEMR